MLSKEEKEKAIIDALRGNPDINERIREQVEGKISKDAYYKIRDGLVRDGKIKKEKRSRLVYLYLPEDEELYIKKAGMKPSIMEKERLPLRIEHTKVLKEKVIKPWLEQLPSIVGSKLIFPKGGVIVANEVLFSDFKKHIKFEPNPYDELIKFMRLEGEFNKKKSSIKNFIIENILYKELKKAPVSFTDKYETIIDEICEWAISMMLYLEDVHLNKKVFKRLYSNFDSYVKETAGEYEYYVSDTNIYCGKISIVKLSKDKFKKEMDEIINIILQQVKESDDIKEDIVSLYTLQSHISLHLYNMRKSLEKHDRVGVLPHDCEYYYWVSNKKI